MGIGNELPLTRDLKAYRQEGRERRLQNSKLRDYCDLHVEKLRSLIAAWERGESLEGNAPLKTFLDPNTRGSNRLGVYSFDASVQLAVSAAGSRNPEIREKLVREIQGATIGDFYGAGYTTSEKGLRKGRLPLAALDEMLSSIDGESQGWLKSAVPLLQPIFLEMEKQRAGEE